MRITESQLRSLVKSFLHEQLSPEDIDTVSKWGRTGIGVGEKLSPEEEVRIREIGERLPKKKYSVLYRGMAFPRGTLYSTGSSSPGKWVSLPAGFTVLDDPKFYGKIISGLRSWTPKIQDAKYYAGWTRSSHNFQRPEGIIIAWRNPNPDGVVLDTSSLKKSGIPLATDSGEVLADASSSRIIGIRYDRGLILDIES